MTNLSKPIDRSKVNERTASMQDMPKSGFDLSYNSYRDYILGRIHVSGYHHIMPADKFSGSNEGDHTFNNLVTPMMSPVDCCQHNFFVTLRSIDKSFEDAFAPSALNGMSASWSAPTFSIDSIVQDLLFNIPYASNLHLDTAFDRAFSKWTTSVTSTPNATELQNCADLFNNTYLFCVGQNRTIDDNLYIRDIMRDIANNVRNMQNIIMVGSTVKYADVLRGWCKSFLFPFIGENSLLDSLGYSYLRSKDVEDIISSIPTTTAGVVNATNFSDKMDTIPQCEYAVRSYFAVWYEYFRDYNLEPVKSTLPKWKDFGSTSIISYNNSLNYGPFFLLTRIRSWYKDPYISSMPDDIMRHVFAPIFPTSASVVTQDTNASDFHQAENTPSENSMQNLRNVDSYTLQWRDVVDGSTKTVKVPVPKRVNDSIATAGSNQSVYFLDLLSLRNAQALERYLKRNFYGGDEYKDRMLSHYGSVISDYSVKRPVLLSSSVSNVELKQEIAPVNTPTTTVGDRTATATCKSGGDGYEFFAEEFGIVLNLIEFMPRAQYAGICPQNLQIHQVDYPIPEFAANNEELSRIIEVATNGLSKSTSLLETFGHHPYAHAYRGRIDEVHGSFLSDRQNYTFRRFFGLDNSDGIPKLNYSFIHCHPNLGMFLNTNLFDCQLYGRDTHNFFVERVLPTPIEVI